MTEVEALAKYAPRASFADLSPFGRPIRDIRQPGASTPIESRPWSGVSDGECLHNQVRHRIGL
jgi:hypothetical protein